MSVHRYNSKRQPINSTKNIAYTAAPAPRADYGVDDPECGLIEFNTDEISEPGDYTYTIRESSSNLDGWTVDDSEQQVILTVTMDEETGILKADQDVMPQFINTYEAPDIEPIPATFKIFACKLGVGADIEDDQFRFGLYDDEGEVVDEVGNGAAIDSAEDPEAYELVRVLSDKKKAKKAQVTPRSRVPARIVNYPNRAEAFARKVQQLKRQGW